MKIGILKTGNVASELAEKHGQYPDMFMEFLAGRGFEFETYKVVDGVFPESINQCDGWIITGSLHGAYEDHPWIAPLEAFIRATYAANVPQVGVCFGHQIMAQAMGGEVEYFGGQWGLGNVEYTMHDGSLNSLLAMHQDQVTKAPDNATVIASSDNCKIAMLKYDNAALSIQPHPEFPRPFMQDLIELRSGKKIPQDQASRALDTIEKPNDADAYADMIEKFFREHALVTA
jgi:GMP synthase (glutamine-hydrolysing)